MSPLEEQLKIRPIAPINSRVYRLIRTSFGRLCAAQVAAVQRPIRPPEAHFEFKWIDMRGNVRNLLLPSVSPWLPFSRNGKCLYGTFGEFVS